jgi:hypothetical protein
MLSLTSPRHTSTLPTPVISSGGIFELGDDTARVLRSPSLLVVARYLKQV